MDSDGCYSLCLVKDVEDAREDADRLFLMGQVAALIDEIQPAGQIVGSMVAEAVGAIKHGTPYLDQNSRLYCKLVIRQ